MITDQLQYFQPYAGDEIPFCWRMNLQQLSQSAKLKMFEKTAASQLLLQPWLYDARFFPQVRWGQSHSLEMFAETISPMSKFSEDSTKRPSLQTFPRLFLGTMEPTCVCYVITYIHCHRWRYIVVFFLFKPEKPKKSFFRPISMLKRNISTTNPQNHHQVKPT